MTETRPHGHGKRLFLISFLILLLELICIRWYSSYVLYLGYFTNFVLLGILLGIGAGILRAQSVSGSIRWVPLILFSALTLTLLTRAQVNPDYEDIIYFTSSHAAISLPAIILLPLVFISVTAIFTFLSQELGTLITSLPPLKAYNLNIFGSLAGIACFALMSYLALPAWIWFVLIAVLLLPFLAKLEGFRANVLLLIGIIAIVAASDAAFHNLWSPYYRLTLIEVTEGSGRFVSPRADQSSGDYYVLSANGAGHQEFTSLPLSKPFYKLPYTSFEQPVAFEDVLVIGAGGGNDVATALANGVEHVDAVEIDPMIVELGRQFHPERPYQDPRVNVYTDDARAFLERTTDQYDLIIYALPDSLVLASNMGSIRLESFLFTLESFESAREHLKPDGLFVLYNYYRNDWLVDKIAGMVAEVFGGRPIVHRFPDWEFRSGVFATIFGGPKASEIDMSQPGYTYAQENTQVLATDDWPFLYMKQPALPREYTIVLLTILCASFVFIWKLSPQGQIRRYGLPYFFMGAAFMLIEARSIVEFLLLFGSTWIVNALVFFAILSVVLIANYLASRYRFTKYWPLYLLLFITLAVNYLVPMKSLFMIENAILRYGLVSALLFSPIFFANLIFSNLFRDSQKADVALGANLLGTMVGGSAEYLALLLGYHQLTILAGFFYLLAFISVIMASRKAPWLS
jgi:SAM-dependent methyltransferase